MPLCVRVFACYSTCMSCCPIYSLSKLSNHMTTGKLQLRLKCSKTKEIPVNSAIKQLNLKQWLSSLELQFSSVWHVNINQQFQHLSRKMFCQMPVTSKQTGTGIHLSQIILLAAVIDSNQYYDGTAAHWMHDLVLESKRAMTFDLSEAFFYCLCGLHQFKTMETRSDVQLLGFARGNLWSRSPNRLRTDWQAAVIPGYVSMSRLSGLR